ncbi:MAG: hypothetical protein AVDCRST_MAG87-1392 [uncultured Thermomicrobiales bacterium]|uniref:Uncharacterized protein n=1 Tax=uncultured Thermomicrobiales bacterium TaxID=1645740 RepID=A0A6J4UUK4_9BACT|nr:MAG: hypothetical protein AVDCRST_MAG87-1392 [uncultured Thermomicrobiales bacterium]
MSVEAFGAFQAGRHHPVVEKLFDYRIDRVDAEVCADVRNHPSLIGTKDLEHDRTDRSSARAGNEHTLIVSGEWEQSSKDRDRPMVRRAAGIEVMGRKLADL